MVEYYQVVAACRSNRLCAGAVHDRRQAAGDSSRNSEGDAGRLASLSKDGSGSALSPARQTIHRVCGRRALPAVCVGFFFLGCGRSNSSTCTGLDWTGALQNTRAPVPSAAGKSSWHAHPTTNFPAAPSRPTTHDTPEPMLGCGPMSRAGDICRNTLSSGAR